MIYNIHKILKFNSLNRTRCYKTSYLYSDRNRCETTRGQFPIASSHRRKVRRNGRAERAKRAEIHSTFFTDTLFFPLSLPSPPSPPSSLCHRAGRSPTSALSPSSTSILKVLFRFVLITAVARSNNANFRLVNRTFDR